MDKLDLILQELSGLKADMKAMEERMDEKLADLKEEHAITRESINTLLEWADDVACVVKIPFAKAN